MLPFTIYLKGQTQSVHVKADRFEFNFTTRNAEEIEPKLLLFKRGEETVAVFLVDELQGFVGPSE